MRPSTLRQRFGIRLFEAFFVCLICADLAFDARCDAAPASAAIDAALSSSTRQSTDACAPECVPDCYCCAHGVAVAAVVVLPQAGPLDLIPPCSAPAPPDGVRFPPYRPPLPVA